MQLTAKGLDETASAVRYEISAAQDDVQEQRRRTQERMLRLDDERTKLLQAHYAGAVALDLLKKEQDRIADEMRAAEAALARTEYTAEQIESTIDKAVKFAGSCHDSYVAGDENIRRQINQALFKRILVTEDGVVEWEYADPIAMLMSAHGAAGPVNDGGARCTISQAVGAVQRDRRNYPCNKKDPSWLTRVFPEACSKEQLLAALLGQRSKFRPPPDS